MSQKTVLSSSGCRSLSGRWPFLSVVWTLIALWVVASVPLLAQSPINGSPKSLIVQASDLPEQFALTGGDDLPTGGYGGLYFRPEILMEANLPAGALLGVMCSVELSANPGQAQLAFAEKNSADSIGSSIGGGPRPGTKKQATRLTSQLEGADEVALYRVAHELNGVQVIDYRYRLRVGNAIANLIVTGRTGDGGSEPPGLEDDARFIAERQVARLLAAR